MFIIGTSNALVSNIYGTVAFKIPVFFASLNEESPKGVFLKVGDNFCQEYFLRNFEGC